MSHKNLKNTEEISIILRQAVRNNNYELIREILSLEERKKILFNSSDFEILSLFSYEIYLNLFTQEESEQLYQQVEDIDIKSDLLLSCSDNFKLQEIENYKGYLPVFINTFQDDKSILIILEKILSTKIIDNVYFLTSIINNIDEKLHLQVMDIIYKNNHQLKLDMNGIYEILNACKIDDKTSTLEKLIQVFINNTNDQISYYGISKVISLFPENQKIEIFNKFLELEKLGKIKNFDYCLSDVFKIIDDKKLDVLKIMLDNDLLKNSNWRIVHYFETLTDNQKDESLNLIYKKEEQTKEKLIFDYEIARIIELYKKEIRLKKFNSLVLNNRKYNPFNVIHNFEDNNFRFETLNELVKTISLNKEELSNQETRLEILEILTQKINQYENRIADSNLIFPDLINFYADTLSLNKENLITFIQKFGYKTLKFLDNQNIRDAINLDKENLNKLIDLFKEENINITDSKKELDPVINALLQREFRFKCKDDYNIYSKLEELISNKELENIEQVLLNISSTININKILKKHNTTLEEFVKSILTGNKETLNILHQITDTYIKQKREDYIKKRYPNMDEELNFTKKYEKNFIKKKYIATTSIHIICYDINNHINKEKLTKEQLELIESKEILESIIKFKKSPKENKLNIEYKKYLKPFEELLNILYEEDKLRDPTNDINAKYIYLPKKVDSEDLLGVISELDIKNVSKFLLTDNNLLKELNEILEKYKLLGWGKTFSSLEESADFEFYSGTIAGIFNYFYRIYPEIIEETIEKDKIYKKIKLTKLISEGNSYASSSSKYSLLLGRQTYRLLAANEGKNKATMTKENRLKLSVEYVKKVFERQLIPLPPIDENIITNGKIINVTVGNTTNIENIVLGEKTNSCMRIGGHFDDLYKECLCGENGFHIVLTNPETGKFISRVSGIRNGNTIFLNELRDSIHSDYTNEDCAETLKIISKILVEKSKDSKFPIDNIVITSDYAMKEYESELQNLYLDDVKEATFGISNNLNIQGKAIILATSREDNSLVDINLGDEKISYYKPQRNKIKEYNNSEALYKVIQFQIINELLNGIPLSDININENQDIAKCITGSDWYISIDKNGNIQQFILDKTKDKERAIEEIKNYLNILKNNLSQNERGVTKK